MYFPPHKQILPKIVLGAQLSHEWLVPLQVAAAIKTLYFFLNKLTNF